MSPPAASVLGGEGAVNSKETAQMQSVSGSQPHTPQSPLHAPRRPAWEAAWPHPPRPPAAPASLISSQAQVPGASLLLAAVPFCWTQTPAAAGPPRSVPPHLGHPVLPALPSRTAQSGFKHELPCALAWVMNFLPVPLTCPIPVATREQCCETPAPSVASPLIRGRAMALSKAEAWKPRACTCHTLPPSWGPATRASSLSHKHRRAFALAAPCAWEALSLGISRAGFRSPAPMVSYQGFSCRPHPSLLSNLFRALFSLLSTSHHLTYFIYGPSSCAGCSASSRRRGTVTFFFVLCRDLNT